MAGGEDSRPHAEGEAEGYCRHGTGRRRLQRGQEHRAGGGAADRGAGPGEGPAAGRFGRDGGGPDRVEVRRFFLSFRVIR